jgi:hypothetical protein
VPEAAATPSLSDSPLDLAAQDCGDVAYLLDKFLVAPEIAEMKRRGDTGESYVVELMGLVESLKQPRHCATKLV